MTLKITELKENIAAYLTTKTELMKLQLQEKIEDGFAKFTYSIIKVILIATFLMAFLLFLGGVLNYFFDSKWLGFSFVLFITGTLLGFWLYFDAFFLQKIKEQIEKMTDENILKKEDNS